MHNKNTKISVILLILIMIMTLIPGSLLATGDGTTTPPTGDMPMLQILNTEGGVAEPNSSTTIKIQLENYSYFPAYDIEVSIEAQDEKTEEMFSLTQLAPVKIPYVVPMQKIDFDYIVMPEPYIEKGTYAFNVNYKYHNSQGTAFTGSNIVYITAQNTASPENISMEATSHAAFEKDMEQDINFAITNIGQLTADDIEVKLSSDTSDFAVSKGSDKKSVGTLEPGGIQYVMYTLKLLNDADVSMIPVTLEYAYNDARGERKTATQTIYLNTEIKEEVEVSTNESVPKIIIDEYKAEPTIVDAGENFDLSISFQNTHSTKSIKNCKIFLTVDEAGSATTGSVFSPVNASNTFYIDNISPKKSVTESITMYTVPDAVPKTYSITVNMEYEDATGKAYTSTDYIGIPVRQMIKVEMGEIMIEGATMVGESGYLMANVMNTGRADVKNLKINVEGDFDKYDAEKYIGELKVGTTSSFEAMVIPIMAGETPGEVIVSYDTLDGETVTLSEPFTLNAMEYVMPEPPIDPTFPVGPVPEEPTTNWWLYGAIGVGGALILLAIILTIMKKRKLKKEFGLDDDE